MTMQTIRGYKFKLYPTPAQCLALAQTAGVVRLVYNLALEQRKIWGGKPYKGGTSRYFSAKGMSGELSALRREFDWIGAVSQTAQNQALIDLDRAFVNFFKNGFGYPKPRKKGRDDSFRHVGREISLRRLNKKWGEVKIPKIGWMRYRHTRDLPVDGSTNQLDIRNATLRSVPGSGWEVSIAVRFEIEQKPTRSVAIGVDRGVTIPYALSNGRKVYLPDQVSRREKLIKRVQRRLSRKRRGSRRYALVQQRLNRLASKNARTRSHTAHVLSRELANTAGMVAIEALRTKNMTASARGTIEEPGRQVRQKAGLNRAILNVGWFRFETQLSYKLAETGGVLIKVPPHYTSQTCACCGHADKKSRQNQASFLCAACGETDNADINAAKTILNLAMTDQDIRRWNTPLLDVEDKAGCDLGRTKAAGEASTSCFTPGLDAHV